MQCSMFFSSILLVYIIFVSEINTFNISQFLTSSYSQVSRSGTAIKSDNEARSNGQTPWTHSSDAHIIRGQNLPLRKNQGINKKYDKVGINDENRKGEVIQERFNPKPWFGYEPNSDSKGPTYIPPTATTNNNDKPPSQTFDSDDKSPSQEFDDSLLSDLPPKNTYGSMYTSYNPPPLSNLQNAPKNPTNFVTTSEQNTKYLPPSEMIKPPKYLSSETPDNDDNLPDKQMPPSSEYYEKYRPPHTHSDSDDDGDPPIKQAFDHPYEESIKGEHTPKFHGIPDYLDHDPNEGFDYQHQHHFLPQHHHHPVIYHEIKTTTEAPMDQRLNKKPYSYYYLGRKLWYIPLYFSVYFIIYIFVLILKSIARHKITFNHYFEDDKREMTDEHHTVPPDVHELGDHVWKDIHAARRKYIM